jgi:hypothetical protein
MNEKNAQNLLTEEKIPIAPMNKEEFEKLKILIDGVRGECFIVERWGSNKIVIVFENPHSKWGEFFTTKYFKFEIPGEMMWGSNLENIMKIEIIGF